MASPGGIFPGFGGPQQWPSGQARWPAANSRRASAQGRGGAVLRSTRIQSVLVLNFAQKSVRVGQQCCLVGFKSRRRKVLVDPPAQSEDIQEAPPEPPR